MLRLLSLCPLVRSFAPQLEVLHEGWCGSVQHASGVRNRGMQHGIHLRGRVKNNTPNMKVVKLFVLCEDVAFILNLANSTGKVRTTTAVSTVP